MSAVSPSSVSPSSVSPRLSRFCRAALARSIEQPSGSFLFVPFTRTFVPPYFRPQIFVTLHVTGAACPCRMGPDQEERVVDGRGDGLLTARRDAPRASPHRGRP